MEKLKRGQVIIIDNIQYIVDNMIEFVEDSWVWQEYGIYKKNGNSVSYNEKYWLTIEENEYKEIEYYLYTKYVKTIDTNKTEFEDGGEKYTLFDDGIATVKSYFGPVDVDPGEQCTYYDYISANKRKIIATEVWCDETEYTIGNKIERHQIEIKDETDKSYISKSKPATSVFGWAIFLIITLIGVAGVITSGNKSIAKYISKNPDKYSYVTSVTNNSNNKKAKVYVTTFTTLDEAVKDIIDGVPEGITEVMEDDTTTENDGYGLETKKEYAYIYLNEDDKIYVQVSNKKYVNGSGTTYHSSHYRHYYGCYNRRYRSTTYYNYANSARQSSINSRSSSGGGTSSGK